MNFKQRWNNELQNIADDFFSKMDEVFGISFSEENLDAQITELFSTYGERTQFFTFMDKNYELNIRSTYEQEHIDALIYRLYVRKISTYFEQNGIKNEYDADKELFKMYMSNPSKQLDDHVLKAIQKGELFCANNEYVCIQWASKGPLTTDVIIAIKEYGYEVISAYPGCYECNRNQDGVYFPACVEEIGDKKHISVGANSYDFFDSNLVFEKEGFNDEFEPEYCYYGFAIAANTDFHTYLKETYLDCKYLDFDGVDEINPFRTVRTKLKELIEFNHLGKKFYMFKWNGLDNNDDNCEFDEDIPVFIPAKILSKGTELFDEDDIELQIFLCGHQAVYCNPAQPHFDSLKFDVIAHLAGERIKSRAQIKEERIAWQYEFPEEKKETLELKKKPAEYMIRIFDDNKDYAEQVIEQCELFNEKHGVYPNVIVANKKTFDAWESSIEENLADNMATDKDYPSDDQPNLFDNIDEETQSECEFAPDESGKGTVFQTSKYSLHLIENEDFQEGVYEILNGYSPQLEENCFIYPVVDAEATGKKIREIMDKQGVTPAMIQKVLNGVSYTAIYNWFNGKAMPRLDYFAVVSNMLNTPIDDMIVVKNQKRESFREEK